MNTVVISGNLTRDVETRATTSGLVVANGRIAINNRKKQGEEWVDAPVFIDIVAFGKIAENFAANTKKGSNVYVSGSLSQSDWEKDGVKKTKIEVIANRIETPKRSDTPTEDEPSAPVVADSDVPF